MLKFENYCVLLCCFFKLSFNDNGRRYLFYFDIKGRRLKKIVFGWDMGMNIYVVVSKR